MKTLLGQKVGMTQIFTESGIVVPVNVINCQPLVVIRQKNVDKDGYKALVVGWQKTSKKKSRPLAGQSGKLGRFERIREIPLPDSNLVYKPGDVIDVSLFEGITSVDVSATSKGKGFAGTVKRHHFNRGPMTHGHDHHRAPGAIAAGTDPGRVFKNTRMSGRMGNKTVTVLSQKLVKIDKANHCLLVQGSVPGGKNSFVIIKESLRK